MKVSVAWLREFVDPPLDVAGIAERLTLGGLEVDATVPAGPPLDGIVVAEVLGVERHPDAERLSVCAVHDGASERTVVCGAPNVRAGLRVALAAPGTVLPGDKRIGEAEIRGVSSAGMLCSAAELGLGEDADGILELPSDAEPGRALAALLDLDDTVIDIDLTPNRGDCFCVSGIARDLGALTNAPFRAPRVAPVPGAVTDSFAVSIEDAQACPRYAGRVIRGVDARAATPLWMVERLRRSGVRSINALVDVTNYVMLELGQPMHAFDLAKLNGGIVVRGATAGETLELLDGQSVSLAAGDLVIADAAGAVALGGVMGGLGSAVTDDTTTVFLESAFFEPVRLAGVARRYRLHTDASMRFERGVDPSGQARAVERATALVLEICGGEAGPCELTEGQPYAPPASFPFRPASVARLLGLEVPEARMLAILEGLGIGVTREGDTWRIAPPPFRFDIALEADVVEEIARVNGYDAIPLTLPAGAGTPSAPAAAARGELAARNCLIQRGYFEAVTYSFIDPAVAARFEPDGETVALANPISSEMAVMRRSLWPGLVLAARHNLNRQSDEVRLFELGMVFRPGTGALEQVDRLAGVRCGAAAPRQWSEAARSCDFFDIKQDVESLLAGFGVAALRVEGVDVPALHPGQSARLLDGEHEIGLMGALHPALSRELGIDKPLFLFELNLDMLEGAAAPQYRPISRFPAVRRDINVVVDAEVSAADCLEAARHGGGELLRDLQLFDVYRGQGIDNDKKSLTLGLIFQTRSSTLTDDEVENAVRRVLASMSERVGGRLRE